MLFEMYDPELTNIGLPNDPNGAVRGVLVPFFSRPEEEYIQWGLENEAQISIVVSKADNASKQLLRENLDGALAIADEQLKERVIELGKVCHFRLKRAQPDETSES